MEGPSCIGARCSFGMRVAPERGLGIRFPPLPRKESNMDNRLPIINRFRIVNSIRRKVSRRNHVEKRLKERFGLEYGKVKNVIDNGGSKVVLECKTGNKIHYLSYMGHEIYFISYRGEIKTFLTKEMVEKSFPEVFDLPEEKKSKRKKKKKRNKQSKLIPASELFKDK
jgi:hypothetical protein